MSLRHLALGLSALEWRTTLTADLILGSLLSKQGTPQVWALLLGGAGNQIQRQVGQPSVRCALNSESKELGCKPLNLMIHLTSPSCLIYICITES